MAPLTVVRDSLGAQSGGGGSRMVVTTESGDASMAFDIAPREIEFDGFALDWATLERVGATPLLVQKGAKLRTLRISTTLTSKTSMHGSQESTIDAFRRIAASAQRVLVRYSRQEFGAWRITEASMKSVLREPSANSITRATIDVTFSEATTGTAGAATSNASFSHTKPETSRARIDVRPGDTLQSLAQRAYGSAIEWPWIYSQNTDVLSAPWSPLVATSLRV